MRIIASLLLLFLTNQLQADQYQSIKREIAEEAVVLLNKQKQIVAWCACCQTKPKRYKIISAEIAPSRQRFVRINVTVKTKNGTKELKWIDLAYIHIKNDKQSACLAVVLGLNADPCTKPFRWKSVKLQ
jgi:hypothetical protein